MYLPVLLFVVIATLVCQNRLHYTAIHKIITIKKNTTYLFVICLHVRRLFHSKSYGQKSHNLLYYRRKGVVIWRHRIGSIIYVRNKIIIFKYTHACVIILYVAYCTKYNEHFYNMSPLVSVYCSLLQGHDDLTYYNNK